MAIKVKKNLVSKSKYNVKCPNSMNAKYITVHNTANDASASSEVKYMNSNNNSVSFHYAVDDKEVIQAVPDNRNAWHCGDGSGVNSGNRTSIGIEICYSKSGGNRYNKAEDLAIKFIAQLLKQRGWEVDRIRKHEDWSGKFCPHRILAEKRWNSFKNQIEAELDKLNNKKTIKAKISTVVFKVIKKSNKLVYTRLLKSGDSGQDVKNLQSSLSKLGFKCTIDGVFGNGTELQVKAFQSKYKLTIDGLVGQGTVNKINSLIK